MKTYLQFVSLMESVSAAPDLANIDDYAKLQQITQALDAMNRSEGGYFNSHTRNAYKHAEQVLRQLRDAADPDDHDAQHRLSQVSQGLTGTYMRSSYGTVDPNRAKQQYNDANSALQHFSKNGISRPKPPTAGMSIDPSRDAIVKGMATRDHR